MAEGETALDVTKCQIVAEWEAEKPLICCQYEPKGRFVFAGGEDGVPRRLALADGSLLPFAGGHESWVFALAFSNDGEITLSSAGDGKIVWWETSASAPKIIRSVEAHRGWCRSLSVSADGAWLASAGNDKVVRIWNVADGALVKELPGHEKGVYSVRFDREGTHLFTGDLAGTVIEWDAGTGQEVGRFDAKALHTYEPGQQVDFGGVRGLALSPDRSRLAAGGLHKATNPLGNVHEPLALTFNRSDRVLAKSHVSDGLTNGSIWGLEYLTDGTLMGVSGGNSGGWLHFWKPDGEKEMHRFKLPNTGRGLGLSPDGLHVAVAHHDAKLRVVKLSA